MRDPFDTPAMRQFKAFKDRHPECVLFFRMGDFYEMFGDDAVALSKALGLTLTQRTPGLPMAGVPHHQLTVYLQRAIDAGFRVAVADQVQDPKDAKGVVERRVTRVVTPGTLVDESLIADDTSQRIGAIAFCASGDDSEAGVGVCDLSTGETIVLRASRVALPEALARCSVRELLYCEGAQGGAPPRVARLLDALSIAGTARPAWQFRPAEACEAIRRHFGVRTLAGFGLGDDDPEAIALGVLLRWLRETQTSADEGDPFATPASLAHVRPPRRDDARAICLVDAVSARALEVERTIRGEADASLCGLFLRGRSACRTAMGKRLIREWLRAPLGRLDEIRCRQRAVGALVEERERARRLGESLAPVQDVERIAGRLALARVTPRDLVALGRSLAQIGVIGETLDGSPPFERERRKLLDLCAEISTLSERICSSCLASPPAHLREGGLIADGVDAELDEARSLQRDAGAWLSAYQGELIARYDLPSLKVGYNKVFGYYIELPAGQARRAPEELTRKQTLKNAERYITPELKDFEEKIATAEARALAREQALFDELCARARSRIGEIQEFSRVAADLDALLCLADKAVDRRWVRPEMTEGVTLEIHGGRHPVLDETLAGSFVPNDTLLDDPARLALITGPNMAGKSTYIRQNALIVLLAHAGSFVPADRATIGLTDRIFTRVGADDALHEGQSTFMVEMTETAHILNNASERSLVILDEIGRGTSTLDGLSLAWAIAERLSEIGCRTLFATHYHELTELEDRLGGRVRNLRVLVREWNDQIHFLHSIEQGRADRSYGVHVAQLAGIPRSVVDRAREVLASLSVQQEGLQRRAPTRGEQLPLFTEYLAHPAIERLREIKLESLSPMQAFDLLRDLSRCVSDQER